MARETKQSRTFTVREVLWAFAALAAVAALLITFSPDHSATVGLKTLSGFLTATALLAIAAAWVVARPGWRWPWLLILAVNMITGAIAYLPAVDSTNGYFIVTLVWAALLAIVFFAWGARLRAAADRRARDAFFLGGLTALFAIGLAIVPWHGEWPWQAEGDSGTLTGITVGVGLFGAYAAIVAVYLAIAGFDRPTPQVELAPGAVPNGAAEASASNDKGMMA